MKIIPTIFAALFALGTLNICDAAPITALYYVSTPGDWVGQGKAKSCVQNNYHQVQNVQITISSSFDNSIQVRISDGRDDWSGNFSAPNREELKKGIYKNAQRDPFQEEGHPGLSFSGCGRCHNTLRGEFEILELQRDAFGELTTFAVNFIQKGNDSPLFGSIRYNSNIPIQEKFLVESY